PRCGDGIVRRLEEECDDGNTVGGDGCSSVCTIEADANCQPQPTACEKISGQCVVRVPATFRDFPASHVDFNTDYAGCSAFEPVVGMVQSTLSPEGIPVYADPPPEACVNSRNSFTEWYIDGFDAVTVRGEIVLFQDGDTFSNRYGPNGERWVMSDADVEQGGYGGSLQECESLCESRKELRCANVCLPAQDTVLQREQALAEAEAAEEASGDELAELQLAIDDAVFSYELCTTECEDESVDSATECASRCIPCSYAPDQW